MSMKLANRILFTAYSIYEAKRKTILLKKNCHTSFKLNDSLLAMAFLKFL